MRSNGDPVLLEREAELAELARGLEGAIAGDGGAVLIEGPAGIGKSELIAAVRREAERQGVRALTARAAELERELSHGIARQLLEPVLAAAEPDQRARSFAGPAALCQTLFELEEPIALDPPDSFQIIHGLYWLVANLAQEEPLLLAIDDLHWADPPSLRLVEYLCRRLEGLPILLVAAYRPTEPGAAPLAALAALAALAVEATASRIEPRPLSEGGSGLLVRERLGEAADPGFCRACHAASDGNPLLLDELTRALAAEGIAPSEHQARAIGELGAQAVVRTVELRLARLPAEVMRFACAAAVLGDGATLRHAATLAELDEERAYEAVAALYQLDILRREPEIAFVHPLVRAAIDERLDPIELERAHLGAARLLAEADTPPERIAAHLLRLPSADDPTVVATLRTAAQRALAAGGAENAVSYLRRALGEPPPAAERAEVLFELGLAEALTRGPEANEHLGQALELASDPSLRGTITEMLTRTLLFAGSSKEAVEVAQRGIEEFGDTEPDLRHRFEAIILNAGTWEPSFAQAGEELAARLRAEDEIDGLGFGARALLGLIAFREARSGVPATEATALARRALEGDLLLTEDNGGGPFILATLVLALADDEEALLTYAAGRDAARKRGDVFALAANQIFTGRAHLLRGALADAVEAGEEGVEATEEYGIRIGPPSATAFLAEAQMESGDLDGAERTLARATMRDEVPDGDSAHWHWFLDTRSRLRIARGDLQGGLAETLECGRRFEAVGGRNPAFIPWRSRAALCLSELGTEPERAERLAAEEVELARAWGAPRALGAALRAQGLVLGGERGLELLETTTETLEDSPARLELAKALTDLGAALRRANWRRDAREPLGRGVELAHACGAAPLERRARQELRATGARPRMRPEPSGPESLTPSERRVAGLAVEGLTNREIAQRLFVTQKTVEAHLSSSYRKLEIDSRSGLRSALGAVGDPGGTLAPSASG